jgi:GAF domain-containing protein
MGAVAAVSRFLLGETTMAGALETVNREATLALPQTAFASLTLKIDGSVETRVATDPVARELDEVQYRTEDGPCLAAFDQAVPVIVPDTGASAKYVALCRSAKGAGIGSVLAVPLITTSAPIGALNLYGRPVDGYRDDDVELAQLFGTQAAFLLSNVQAYWDARTLNEHLAEAMRSRAQIEQAKGILMATTGCDADAAFEQLREQSQHENVRIRDLAGEMIRRATRAR